MKRPTLGIVVLCGLLSTAVAMIAMANKAVDGDEPAIMVSPNTIVLAKVGTVTIHTNIPAAIVDLGSIDLDGVAPTRVGVDDCGDLVAKFRVADLGLEPGKATLTLSGDFKNGDSFSATGVVRVK